MGEEGEEREGTLKRNISFAFGHLISRFRENEECKEKFVSSPTISR